MIAEAKVALRNFGLLLTQRGFYLVAGVAFAFLVPRLMGPETFGRYALITSVSMWFAFLSGLSSVQLMGRFVPELVMRNGGEEIKKLFGNLLVVRAVSGVVAAVSYFALTALWFRELDALALALIAGSVMLRAAAKLSFALLLGLNEAARWGMGEMFRRWLSLALIIPGFYYWGLRGACLALLVTEGLVLAIGIRWAGSYFSWSQLRLDRAYIAPYLRFGLAFFAGNLLIAVSQRSGEVLVRMASGDYVEVGFFGAAFRVYVTGSVVVWQFAMAFAPLFTILLTKGRGEELQRWAERLLKWTAIGGICAVYAAVLLGDDIVPVVFGREYGAVAANLIPLTISLVTLAMASVARLLSLSYDRPRLVVSAAAMQLLTFWGLGVPLVRWYGSLGGSIAVLASSILFALFFTWNVRKVIRYSLRDWWVVILLGTLFAPLALLRSPSAEVNLLLFGFFVVGFGAALYMLRVVTMGEVGAIRTGMRSDPDRKASKAGAE